MNGEGRWNFLPLRLPAVGGAWAVTLIVGSWAAALGGCVREYPADHWVPGVRCDDAGICLAERPDRRSSTFALAPDCWRGPASAAEAGINPQRMTLIGDGKEIVFAAEHATNADATSSTARIAIARFGDDVGGDGDCPEMEWQDDHWVGPVVKGAHVVGPDGRFWSFVGDIGGTRGAMAYDRVSGWVPYEVASPAPPVTDETNWGAPNALAIALPASGVAILRSVASGDDKPNEELPTALERWTFGPDRTPAWMAQTQLASGVLGYTAAQSVRGQVRLFPVAPCPPGAQRQVDSPGDCLVVLGDRGRAVALSVGDSTAVPMTVRRAGASDERPNLGATSVLLPLRSGSTYAPGSVLYIGGGPDGDPDLEIRQRLDLFDPACGTWTSAVGALPRGRSFATPVLLPDGRILLAGDSQGAHDIFYIDPRRDFAVTVGHDRLSRTRGMGVGGLVLADGRVVLAGGREPDGDDPRASPDVDVWQPPYLDAGARPARPTIRPVSAPIPIDARFTIELAPGSPPVTEVVLLAYGSSFMGNNPNQRLVELAIEPDGSDSGSNTIALRGPPARWAPEGRYLLFALGDDRIPSVGMPVDLVQGGGEAGAGP